MFEVSHLISSRWDSNFPSFLFLFCSLPWMHFSWKKKISDEPTHFFTNKINVFYIVNCLTVLLILLCSTTCLLSLICTMVFTLFSSFCHRAVCFICGFIASPVVKTWKEMRGDHFHLTFYATYKYENLQLQEI